MYCAATTWFYRIACAIAAQAQISLMTRLSCLPKKGMQQQPPVFFTCLNDIKQYLSQKLGRFMTVFFFFFVFFVKKCTWNHNLLLHSTFFCKIKISILKIQAKLQTLIVSCSRCIIDQTLQRLKWVRFIALLPKVLGIYIIWGLEPKLSWNLRSVIHLEHHHININKKKTMLFLTENYSLYFHWHFFNKLILFWRAPSNATSCLRNICCKYVVSQKL